MPKLGNRTVEPHRTTVLGLDIGGANLKAATATGRAISVPFPLWKQPDELPAALAALLAEFLEINELAITMTGELCDCYATKREGVNRILDAVEFAAASINRNQPVPGTPGVPPVGAKITDVDSISLANRRDAGPTQDRRDTGVYRIRIWNTAGEWLTIQEARVQTLAVAGSNWHALATFAGRFAPQGNGLLVDIGSTTTDIIPLSNGWPQTLGHTDWDRLHSGELVYVGVKRTPIMALGHPAICSEYFADARDMHIVLGQAPEDPTATDTADGRPATMEHCLARMARMIGGDLETLGPEIVQDFAIQCFQRQRAKIVSGIHRVDVSEVRTLIVSGAGEWLAREAWSGAYPELKPRIVSLKEELGPDVSECAPAYAVAVLATEMPV